MRRTVEGTPALSSCPEPLLGPPALSSCFAIRPRPGSTGLCPELASPFPLPIAQAIASQVTPRLLCLPQNGFDSATFCKPGISSGAASGLCLTYGFSPSGPGEGICMIPAFLLGKLRQGPVKKPVVQLGSGEAGHSSLGASLLWGTWAGGGQWLSLLTFLASVPGEWVSDTCLPLRGCLWCPPVSADFVEGLLTLVI